MANEVLNPRQEFKDDGNTPLALGSLEFFVNGQEITQLPIFSDSGLTVAQSNPYTLDHFGVVRGDVHYSGLATIVVSNAAGQRIRRLDDVVASSAGDTNLITIYEPSVAAMVSDNDLVEGDVVRTAAYYGNTNIGGARYVIVAAGTGTADNFFFHNLGNGLQAKLLDRERRNNFIYAGARGDGGTDDETSMQAVINACTEVEVPDGFTFVAANLLIPHNIRFVGGGAMLQLGNSSGDLFQITSIAVTSVKFKGVILDGNQQNGNQANATVGWVLSA